MIRAVLGLFGIVLVAMFALTTVLPTPEADAQQRRSVRIGVPGFGVFTIPGGRARGRRGGGQSQQAADGTNLEGDVAQVQTALAAFEFNPGPINGKMGQQTRNAISRYQKSLGERATGRLTEEQQDTLLNNYCVGSAPERNPTLESLFLVRRSDGGTTSFAPDTGQGASLRAVCMRTFSNAASDDESRKLLPDQFCVSRAYAMDTAAQNIELRLEAQKQATRETIRAECSQRAEATRGRTALLDSLSPAELAKRLTSENTVPEDGVELAAAQAQICLGIGYAEDRPDVALAGALDLIGLGETGFGELIAAHFALGVGVKRNAGRAAAWLELAATEVRGGVSPVGNSDAACRWRVLRHMASELTK